MLVGQFRKKPMASDSSASKHGKKAQELTSGSVVSLRPVAKNFALILSLAIFIVCLGLVLIGSRLLWTSTQEKIEANQKLQQEEIKSQIARLLKAPNLGLVAVSTHVETEKKSSNESFSQFINGINLFGRIRGLESIGLLDVAVNSANELGSIQASVMQPILPNNSKSSFRFFENAVLREAMKQSFSSSTPAISQSILLDPNNQKSLGLVYLAPVYKTDSGLQGLKEKKKFVGFVYAKILLEDLLSEQTNRIHTAYQFNLYEQNKFGKKLIFANASHATQQTLNNQDRKPSTIRTSETIEILGNNLEIEFIYSNSSKESLLAWLPFAITGGLFGLGLSCIFWLLAQRKDQAQSSVKKINAELSTMAKVAKHTDNSVIITNLDYEVIWVNQSFERTFGYATGEALGHTLKSLFSTETTDLKVTTELVEAIHNRKSWHNQLPLRDTDNRELWFDVELQPIYDEDATCIGFIVLGSEITALRQAQATAIEQRNRWESIARASNLGVVFWNKANKSLDCNAAFAFMLGYQLEEIENFTTHQLKELTHENDLHVARSEMIKIISGELVNSIIDIRLKHRKGHWAWVNVNIQLQERNPDGSASTILMVYVDNTVAKAREDEWRARADLSADWYWRTDPEHRFIDVSTGDTQATRFMSGLIGKKRDEVPNFEAPSVGWAELHARMNKGEYIRGVQHRDISDPERPSWIEIQGKPIWSANGEFLGYSGIGRDVTVNQSATEALRDSLALVDSLFEALPLPLAMKDVNGHFVRSNSAYSDLFNIQPSVLFNAQVSDIMDTETAEIHQSEDLKVLKEKQSREYEVVQNLPSKPPINALVRKAPVLDTSGEPVGIVDMIIDVTKQRQAESAERHAKEEALLASKSKSAFLATMSHEIRTPMNGVLGMAELLSLSGLDADQSDAVKTIRESAANLLNIIDDILDFSKIEAGHLTIENEPIDLLAIVESVADALQQVAVQKKVRLDVFVDPNIPEQVLGDSIRLRQVLNNLVGNAIKFTSGLPDREGQVYLRIEPIGADQLHFTISDNGIGISEESRVQLFAAFTQAERTTARRYGGTGLGLVICQRIIGAMGGSIQLESEVGVGSKFSFVLSLPPVIGLFPGMDRSLNGINCHLLNLNETQSLDWSAYLQSAGACVFIVKEFNPAKLQIGQNNVLLTNDTSLDEDIRERADRWNSIEQNCSLVIIGQGNRKQARLIKTGVVHFDLVRKNTICEAVKLATGKSEVKPTRLISISGTITSTPPPTIEAAERDGRLILVAEDDPINRKVISQQLATIGYAAETVEDGVAALEKWRSGRFSLLLTDLHMPILDGYDLTRTIRAFESEFQRIPILALTANALTGEDAKARDAGIDAYLTKPITLSKLRQELIHWLPNKDSASIPDPLQSHSVVSADAAAVKPQEPAVFDNGVLKVFVGDDLETINELLNDYIDSLESSRVQMTRALSQGMASEAASIAHRLKSSSRSVGALRLGEWCSQLEQMSSEQMAAEQTILIDRFQNLASEVTLAIRSRNESALSQTV
jgi:PAS domain S-box-containing protein